MKTNKIFIFALFAVLIFAACGENQREQEEREQTERMEAEREAEMRAEEERMERENNSITARFMERDSLSTFSNSLQRGDLAQTLTEEEGPYTIFAPTNSAFENMDEASRDELLNEDNNSELESVMRYHVVEDSLSSEKLNELIEDNNGEYNMNTLEGEELIVMKSGEEDIVLRDGNGNTATVTETDIEASNGIIHLIDAVVRKQEQ